ncbi:Dipeptidyl aminopeptidase/acylaminoacyl peptidase [Streptomyces sp. WMMB 714]|uniref:S9 family peptidase n=1 Tax=Streptomyces sp. WMMB 714 TaxID=1286822 RepID=UPI0005F7936E|nr:prolyl oligopeptidase family serine peptidase [Streptomyces sp. WMMB 714]SCK51234.1 Dipeptidyl aminopeptidase/acylaminoacyl peptidase [Streptomyces sp. WMMB 714]
MTDTLRGTAGPRELPYGTWESPVSAEDAARGDALLEWTGFLGEDVCWTEVLPEEDGRSGLMAASAGGVREVLPSGAGWDVRSRVIEYGGRPWLALSGRAGDGIVFSHGPDQRVYHWRPGSDPFPLTPPGAWAGELRYADFAVRGGEVWCLRETVTDSTARTAARHLVALPLDGSAADVPSRVRVLAATHHFMTGPRIEPGGDRVAWLGWNHPDMPWDATVLMVAGIHPDGTLGQAAPVMGGDGEAVTQADWATDGSGTLYAVSDPGGWWNVHAVGRDGKPHNLCPRAEEFGEALWRIGLRWCLPLLDGRLAVIHGVGERKLGVLAADGTLTNVAGPATEWHFAATDGRRIAAVCSSPAQRRTVVLADPARGTLDVVRAPTGARLDAYATTPYRRTYSGGDGPVHAHVYPPYHPDVTGPDGELPPWLVFVHGGPTSRTHMVLNQEISYFTSRGIGVVDVQYGGSTGYGRAYRERLRGNWGLTDVADCATVVRGLVADGLAAAERIAVRGGSAGGWTAAASLTGEPDLYRAAGIYYPVLDPVSWRDETHDFESRYLDTLIGPWPDSEDRYAKQSPLHGAEHIRAPFVLLQGLDDTVCPPAQAERLLRAAGDGPAPYRYLTFPGEGHGFRRSATIADSLAAELRLYGRALGFAPAR